MKLHCLLQIPELQKFIASEDFFQTLRAVQVDDAKNKEFQGAWAAEPLAEAWIYQDDPNLWQQLESTYTVPFKSLVYGPLPRLDEVRQSLRQLAIQLRVFWQ